MSAGIDEILPPLIVIEGVKERSETTGENISPERISTVVLTTPTQACAWSALTSTFTSIILPYATVILTIPVESYVIVKLPLVEDWSEPKSIYPMRVDVLDVPVES